MKNRMATFLAALALAFPLTAAGTDSYGIPTEIQDANILHCFNWTFSDIKSELPAIAAAGFGSIQVSPVQGNASSGAEWFFAYMPYDFTFRGNGNGTRTQLQDLCAEASKYNIKIIVDVVANHVNQASGYHDTWWDSNGRVRWNGGVDYNNRYSITHGQVGDYGDVNSEDAEVQARAKAFVEMLKGLGVKGIRWDAAKHIGLPSEGCAFWSAVTSVPGMWHYGEILDGPGGDTYTLLKEYAGFIGVTDTEYSKWTRQQVEHGTVPTGHGSWTPNGVPAAKVVYWGESHDDYANDGQYGENTAMVSQDIIDRAWAITACRDGETSLYLSRPSATSRNAIRMGQKGSTHFTAPQIAEVNKFRNAMTGRKDYFVQQDGVACITRDGGGAVIVVGAGGSRRVSIANGGAYVPAGTYTDRVSGNTFTVTATTITGQTGATGIAVIYDGEVGPVDPIDPIDPVDPSENAYCYLANTAGWNAPHVWAWDASNGDASCVAASAWPGDAMTREGNTWKWMAPAGKTPTHIIFSDNGNNQTANLTFTNGATYRCDGTLESGGGEITVTMPASLYVLGDMAGNHWDTSRGVAMHKDGNTFVANDITFEAAEGQALAFFNLSERTAATWDELNSVSNRYGAADEGMTVAPDTSAPMVKYALGINASACKSWTVTPGTYTLVADFAQNTVRLSRSGGADDTIAAESVAPEYYNLQGVRVTTPSHGIYIVRRGSTVTKEYVQ